MNRKIDDRPPMEDLEILWTPEQVAKYFSISRRTVYQWISDGKTIDPSRIVKIGSRVRIPRGEVARIAGNIRKGINTK